LAHASRQPCGSFTVLTSVHVHLTIVSPDLYLETQLPDPNFEPSLLVSSNSSSANSLSRRVLSNSNKRPNTPHRHLPTIPPPLPSRSTTGDATMSADLTTILLQFQPESEELRQRQKYDLAARSFVTQLNNISQSHWLKGADTPQDVLEVSYAPKCSSTMLTAPDTQSYRELHSIRLCSPPSHRCNHRQEDPTRLGEAWWFIMEQASAVSRDLRPYTDALCWT
jgi:hypothetical protein